MSEQNQQDTVRVVGICGSLRPGSYTRMVIHIALRGAAELGVETALIDLRDYDLGFADGRRDRSTYPPDVHRLCEQIGEAHGIILGTPEYHGSFSGVLKNMLDLTGFEEFEGKMIGLVGVSGGVMGALNALNSLRIVGRALRAWVVPEQASIPRAYQVFEADGSMNDPKLEKRVLDVGRQVARFAYLHMHHEAQAFMAMWEQAPVNPGAQMWSDEEGAG